MANAYPLRLRIFDIPLHSCVHKINWLGIRSFAIELSLSHSLSLSFCLSAVFFHLLHTHNLFLCNVSMLSFSFCSSFIYYLNHFILYLGNEIDLRTKNVSIHCSCFYIFDFMFSHRTFFFLFQETFSVYKMHWIGWILRGHSNGFWIEFWNHVVVVKHWCCQ